MTGLPIISLLTFTPLAGAVMLLLVPDWAVRSARRVISLVALGITAWLAAHFNPDATAPQFAERLSWIPSMGVDYFVGVDGLGLVLVLLSALLVPLGLEVAGPRGDHPGFCALVFLLQTALFGTFTSLNFIPWFLYWELGLVPAYFLVKLWGSEDRRRAATQFFVYTFAGSVAMLLAMQVVFLAAGTFDLLQLRDLAASGDLGRRLAGRVPGAGDGAGLRLLLFAGVFVGLAVKIPLFPFHGWLAPTYASAPPAVTVLLTGAMSKMGVYGFLRILLPVFPEEVRALLGPLVALSVVSILFAAFAGLAQPDLRRMLAYSSMNHLGYAVLGLLVAMDPAAQATGANSPGATALSGVVLQLFNHGITAAALFACVELLERRTRGTSRFDQLGGLRSPAPVFAGLMGISVFASLGLPGLNGFIGEFLIFAGVFPVAPLAAALSLPGLLISAWFLLNLLQRVFQGPTPAHHADFQDLNTRERLILAPAVALMFALGVFPQWVLQFVNPAVRAFLAQTGP